MGDWLDTLTVYLRRRVLVVLVLGFASGLPLALSFSTLSVWMTEAGVDLTTIGVFALVGTPYTLKFLWAPLIDRAPLPLFTRLLGRRRGWMVAIQLGLMGSVLCLGLGDPVAAPAWTALAALMVSFMSASQDIVIDAYRIESLEPDEQGAGAASIVLGYRVGMLASGAGALFAADHMSWSLVYALMAALVLIGMAVILMSPEPAATQATTESEPKADRGATVWLRDAVLAPFTEFLSRPGWLAVLMFILLYKLGDAFAGVMSNPFYVQLGFSKTDIAEITKLFGLAALLIGLFLGGLMVKRLSLLMALLICGILQAGSNLMFVVLALAGADREVLALTIAAENITGGMGTAAFVAYLSSLTNIAFTATQYSLLSSFMAFGRTVLSSSGGWFAEQMGWVDFFLLSTAIALPGLVLLMWMRRAYPDPAQSRA